MSARQLAPVLGRKTACDRTGAGHAHLLAEDRPEGQLIAIDVPWRPEARHRHDRRAEDRIGPECLEDRDRIGIEIEQPAEPADRRREVADVVEGEQALQITMSTGIDPDLGYGGPVRQGERPAVMLGVALLDSWDRPRARNPKSCADWSGGRYASLRATAPGAAHEAPRVPRRAAERALSAIGARAKTSWIVSLNWRTLEKPAAKAISAARRSVVSSRIRAV